MPGQGGEASAVLPYQKPSIWNTYQPETWRLPEALRGVHTLGFSLDSKVHFKGFSFARQSRSLRYNRAVDADEVYGDSFRRESDAVLDIGNNVTLTFRHMDFAGRAGAADHRRAPRPWRKTPSMCASPARTGRVTACAISSAAGPAEQAFDVQYPPGRVRGVLRVPAGQSIRFLRLPV